VNIRDNAEYAIACLFGMIGHEPDQQTFRFHGEDPRTTHKGCPGKNVGSKQGWIMDVESRMAELYPGSHHAVA
jgi:hypothetical protein